MRSANAVQQMREEVARLREDELSFSKIAKSLAISKAYAVKLSQDHRDGSPTSVSGHSKALNPRQRRFVAGLADGKTHRQAAVDAGVPPGGADSFAQRALKDERLQETFTELLDRVGLSEERILRVLMDNLEATKVVSTIVTEGKVSDVLLHPDYAVRQRAAQLALELYGRRRATEPEVDRPVIEYRLTLLQATQVERLTGTRILNDEQQQQAIDSGVLDIDPSEAARLAAGLPLPAKADDRPGWDPGTAEF